MLAFKPTVNFRPEHTVMRVASGRVAGFAVTDSGPIPWATGVFIARVVITFGALSISERPLKLTKLNTAGVPTVVGQDVGKQPVGNDGPVWGYRI